jgi:alpha-1,2-mannosyltransferase
VLSPFAVPPFAVVATVWSVATIAVVIALSHVVVRRTAPGPDTGLRTGLVCLALFLSVPVSSNLRFGQISIFLVALVLLDALKLVPERFQGIATGIAGAIKLTPLIFVPYFWLCGRRRTAITAAVTFAASTALAWAVLPGESRRFWLTELFNVNRVGNIATGGNQSLNGALLRADLPDTARTAVVGLLGGAVVVVALWRGVRAYRNDDLAAGAVMVGAAGLVLSPVSWTHHQVWLVLAAFLAVSTRRARNLWWAAVVLVIMVLPVISIGADSPIGGVTGNARVWLAIAVAALVPFVAVRRRHPPAEEPAGRVGGPAGGACEPGRRRG